MRPIDADFLIDCIKSQLGTGEVLFDEVMKKFIGILEATPTIDAVSVVRGEWIEAEEDWRQQIAFWRCSECGHATSTMYNFCPNCGAKMKGADDD